MTFTVVDTPNYIEVADLAESLSLQGQVYALEDMKVAVSAVSRLIDNTCGRFFYLESQDNPQYYDAATPDLVILDDMVYVTEVAVDYTGNGTFSLVWKTTDYDLGPYNNPGINWPYTWLRRRPFSARWLPTYFPKVVRVTGRYGWPAVPDTIKDAATMLAHRHLRRMREAPFGIVTVGMEAGGRLMRIARTDPDVFDMLSPYIVGRPF